MKVFRVLSAILCLVPLGAFAADLTASVNTERRQLYNKGYRDVKDGTNAETVDNVYANTYGNTVASTTFKTSGGYLDCITFEPCQASYFIGDSTFSSVVNGFGSAGFGTIIDTATVAGTVPVTLHYHARFLNGLTIAVGFSSCTATVSYR